MGWSDRVGSLAVGRFADLVAVDGRPARGRHESGAAGRRRQGRGRSPSTRRGCAACARWLRTGRGRGGSPVTARDAGGRDRRRRASVDGLVDGDAVRRRDRPRRRVTGHGGTLCLPPVTAATAWRRRPGATPDVPGRGAAAGSSSASADGNPPSPSMRHGARSRSSGGRRAGRHRSGRGGLDARREGTARGRRRSTPGRPSSPGHPAGCSTSRPRRSSSRPGAAELQPVCPGNDLDGISPPARPDGCATAGVELPEPVVTVGRELVRFEGDADGRVTAVVTDDGRDRSAGRTVIVDLGGRPATCSPGWRRMATT